MQRWSVVIPAKRLAAAKTRLRPLTGAASGAHAELVLALLADTVAAAAGCPAVREVLVVTDDPQATAMVTAMVTGAGARALPDRPDRGLNPALVFGARAAAGDAVAALASDLPALRPAELTAALAAAALLPRAFATDADRTGTTLLTAVGVPLDPRFGPASAAAHAAQGAVALPPSWPGLARDVDTETDLRAALTLGVGPRTAAVLERLRLVSSCG